MHGAQKAEAPLSDRSHTLALLRRAIFDISGFNPTMKRGNAV